MTYILQDGTVSEKPPFNLSTLTKLFWGIISFIYLLIASLFNPNANKKDSRYSTDYRPPGGGPPRPQNKFKGFGPSNSPGAPPTPGCGCGG